MAISCETKICLAVTMHYTIYIYYLYTRRFTVIIATNAENHTNTDFN